MVKLTPPPPTLEKLLILIDNKQLMGLPFPISWPLLKDGWPWYGTQVYVFSQQKPLLYRSREEIWRLQNPRPPGNVLPAMTSCVCKMLHIVTKLYNYWRLETFAERSINAKRTADCNDGYFLHQPCVDRLHDLNGAFDVEIVAINTSKNMS